MNIDSQTILVTGANGGIGRALVKTFLAAGAKKSMLAREILILSAPCCKMIGSARLNLMSAILPVSPMLPLRVEMSRYL